MKMNYNSIKNTAFWENANVKLPQFNIEKALENSQKSPKWIHFGAGNIFRGFIARINQTMLEKNVEDTGMIAVDSFDYDIIDKIYTPFDNLTMLVRLKADGNMEKEIIAGVTQSYKADCELPEYQKLIEAFQNPSLQMLSFTVTEKAYILTSADGEFFNIVADDIANGTKKPKHIISIICSLLFARFNSGKLPLAVCSMDNCSHNGEKLRTAVLTIANKWLENGFVTKDFINYVSDEKTVSFPWSMIDKITPRPAVSVQEDLEKLSIEDMKPIITSKNTFIAPFVNAEIPEYLVIEDNFPNGRPALFEAGVYLTDRETVNKVETMKVTTCLNPLHTALAVFGCLLGYTRIFKEMDDAELRKLVEKIGYEEGMKVVVDPKIIDPKAFIDEVINERFSNPFVPDEPQRIATDTSQKVGIRFGETIKAYVKSSDLDVNDLTFIPLAIAGWFRYLLAVDDEGNKIELNSDPMLNELTTALKTVKLGGEYNGELLPILKNKNIFGQDLTECGLSDKIETMFKELIVGEQAVRKTLKKYLQK